MDNLQQSWRRILAADQGVVAAAREYRVEQLQFRLGQRTSTEVLTAASSLGSAQAQRISAFVDYEIWQINVASATGTLLGRERVQLPPATL